MSKSISFREKEKAMRVRSFRKKLYEIIFEADTPAGKAFDVILLLFIVVSILAVILESVPLYGVRYGRLFSLTEWVITFSFTVEYLLRIWVVERPPRYIFSFYGIIDLLSVLPSYIGLFAGGAHGLMIIRALRLLRIFRLFKLSRYISEANLLMLALKNSREKISVFLMTVVMLVIVLGTLMYMIEGEQSGFTSIPRGIYWAIVTLTTVGYGDIAPVTPLGQFVASLVMILGYGIIAVPTGIVTVEYSRVRKEKKVTTQVCPVCLREGHDADAGYCKYCGAKLNPEE